MPRVYTKQSVADRFWSKVDKGGDDECWPWMGARCRFGLYGRFGFNTSRPSSTRNAHTVAWELDRRRELPDGKVVRHRCDNPCCCNPKHLVLGTQRQNMADMHTRGRAASTDRTRHIGEEHGRSLLTESIVRAARIAHRDGASFAVLARLYRVNESTMARAVRGESWSHLAT